MSLDASRWAWEQQVGKASAKLILLSLADRAGEHHTCYPSLPRLEADTGLNKKTIISGLKYLEKNGFLQITKTEGRPNNYQLIGVPNRHEKSTAHNPKFRAENGATQVPNTASEPTNATPKSGEAVRENKFSSPTLEAVTTYCREQGIKIDPGKFFDYYQSNGWKVGKNSMKDWKAAIRYWDRGDKSKKSGTYKPTTEDIYADF